jgi:hypothetical protein
MNLQQDMTKILRRQVTEAVERHPVIDEMIRKKMNGKKLVQ